MRLLIVEDEVLLCDAVAESLRLSGYAVDAVYDGESALEALVVEPYDLMILDLNLPGVDGLEVLRMLRKEQEYENLRILILTARSSIDDQVRGLDLGANDYLTKPFELAELEARVRSLLRRSFHTASAVLEYGVVRMDSNSRKVYVNKTEVRLTKTETAILEYMLRNQDKVVSQEELMEHIYDSNVNYFSDVLRVHIHSLRKKLQKVVGYNPILTKIGEGYYMTKPAEEELL